MENKKLMDPMMVNGREYLTVEQFAMITGKTPGHILRLVLYGNRIRKMRNSKILNKTIIPIDELGDFPFIRRGRGEITEVYHYDKEGEKVFEPVEEYYSRTEEEEENYGEIDDIELD